METAMTLLMYQVLKTVTEQGSFRKAAELLGLTIRDQSRGCFAGRRTWISGA